MTRGIMSKGLCFLIFLLFVYTIICSAHRASSLHFDHSSFVASFSYYNQIRKLSNDGPGSNPPRCTGKCGACTPCLPVHVAVPPGVPVTAEYYPEAWRCKCGNKLYMP